MSKFTLEVSEAEMVALYAAMVHSTEVCNIFRDQVDATKEAAETVLTNIRTQLDNQGLLMSDLETIAAEIENWLEEQKYQILKPHYPGGWNQIKVEHIPAKTVEALAEAGFRAERMESWHISLKLRSDYHPIAEHKYDELSVAILEKDSKHIVEIWVTDMHEQTCNVETIDYDAVWFWEDFTGFMEQMAEKSPT